MPTGWKLGDGSTYTGATNGYVVPTVQSMELLNEGGTNVKWFPYMPWKGRNSPFFQKGWIDAPASANYNGLTGKSSAYDIFMAYQPVGGYVAKNLDKTGGCTTLANGAGLAKAGSTCYNEADFSSYTDKCGTAGNVACTPGQWSWPVLTTLTAKGETAVNIASRMIQFEANSHAQCSYFVSIVVVQWADLIICKTRMNSLYHQGMSNPLMNFGLVFETILACFFCYLDSPFNYNLGVRPLRLVHWFPAIPFSVIIVCYDELRKYWMRGSTKVTTDKSTKQVLRDAGWLERNSYY